MIDEPGPWGTGPFTLVQGASSIVTRNAIMSPDPYTCAWLIESEDRSPEVVLEANPAGGDQPGFSGASGNAC
ncbi:hypothetical protein ACVGVM_22925 [Pseudonocardia bannensis]|uniref:Uncharacterized protein n=1 Tax=Pseudonocardia bannensis TaxID=630973 RepID=A0A848DPH2_9PSEU|nr:hypothetical protein [Pseudonocardia bannensis]NMH94291.1 hypothetical protein [Pseudonocardia bannensis]